jgi:hypothetical protein
VQQKEVAPVAVAVPVGMPPSARAQEPASATVGLAASFTVSGGVKALQVAGAGSVPPEGDGHSVSIAGEGRVHVAPVGSVHWHAVQPRWSSTPA